MILVKAMIDFIFFLQGGGIVHLTGYLMETPEYDFDESDFEEEESEVEENEAEDVDDTKKASNGVAKKADIKKLSPLDKLVAEAKKKDADKVKKPEEIKAEIKKAEEMKKILAENKKLGDSDSDEDEDDSDDDDDNMLDMEAEEEVISLIYENVIKLVAI